MKICVTGASGFIGQEVAAALAKAGHTVVGLDKRLVDGWGNGEYMERDITHLLEPIPGLDAVVHLAAVANPRECERGPDYAFAVNVHGTFQVLQMALLSGAKKFVFASSAHIYGISAKYLPSDENHPFWFQNNRRETQIYTLTKIAGEQLCKLYEENYGLSYTTLRLFNVYGPGQALGYFVPDMVAKAQKGALHLDGANVTKDWVNIKDVARAFAAAVKSDFVGPINIGSGSETELGAVASSIALKMGVPFTSTPSPTPTRMLADIRRAERVLGWKPTISLEEGLDSVIAAKATVPA